MFIVEHLHLFTMHDPPPTLLFFFFSLLSSKPECTHTYIQIILAQRNLPTTYKLIHISQSSRRPCGKCRTPLSTLLLCPLDLNLYVINYKLVFSFVLMNTRQLLYSLLYQYCNQVIYKSYYTYLSVVLVKIPCFFNMTCVKDKSSNIQIVSFGHYDLE